MQPTVNGRAEPRQEAVLRVERISKTFPGTRALDRVELTLERGEIHALLGNNGSGKSTLIKILAGVYVADAEHSGEIRIGGERFDASRWSPAAARRCGLHFVHQVPALFPMMSVAENIAIGRGFETHRGDRIDWAAQRARAQKLIERFHIHAVPEMPVGMLEPADRTLVAIARALQDQDGEASGVLILDEPTAALPGPEVERLIRTLRGYAAAGQTILYVSHRLDEVLRMSDRVSALRDGRNAGTAKTSEMDETKLVSLMMGREVERVAIAKQAMPLADPRLSVRGLRSGKAGAPRELAAAASPSAPGIDLDLAPGEVVGLAGLLGSGTSDILRALFGAQPLAAGTLRLDGAAYAPSSPADAIARRVAYLPPDRATDASFNAMSVRANLSAVNVSRYFQGLRLRHDREHADASAAIDRFMIRAASDLQPMATLSGGNQQKVILSRWLRDAPRLFLLDEPTQGVAAHARREIHGFLREAASQGTTLLVVSSDFDELAQLCDRVLVVVHGRIAGEVRPPDLDAHRLTEFAHFAQVSA